MDKNATSEKMKGNWNQFKGKLREKWGNLTDDELDRMQGQREQLAGHLQKKSGERREQIDQHVDRSARDTGYRFE